MVGEGKESVFNEAISKMGRIHNSQQLINDLRLNLLAKNTFVGKHNYELVLTELFSLCNEVRPLMKTEERETFKRYRELVTNLLELKPVFIRRRVDGLNPVTKEFLVQENWRVVREIIFAFEDFAREQVEKHGLSSPTKLDPTKAAINL
tara:strand:+ start:403 stop:849 length:447 start_codon:yes stop_codon:yes gene_type:complete